MTSCLTLRIILDSEEIDVDACDVMLGVPRVADCVTGLWIEFVGSPGPIPLPAMGDDTAEFSGLRDAVFVVEPDAEFEIVPPGTPPSGTPAEATLLWGRSAREDVNEFPAALVTVEASPPVPKGGGFRLSSASPAVVLVPGVIPPGIPAGRVLLDSIVATSVAVRSE